MWDNLTVFFSDGENIAFLILSVLIITGAVFMINLTRVVHMVTSLAFAFLGLAGLYIMLNAEFVALVQVLIYAGAITILMIFGIMMTNHSAEEEQPWRPWHHGLVLTGCLVFFAILFFVIGRADFQPNGFEAARHNTQEIGELLVRDHVISFELISLLLTTAFIGAIILAKKEDEPNG